MENKDGMKKNGKQVY